ncbi:17506_t:CDS:1, partial [Racocetra persica]
NRITTPSASTSDASSTTSAEIHSYFFNIQDPFKVTDEEFNDN